MLMLSAVVGIATSRDSTTASPSPLCWVRFWYQRSDHPGGGQVPKAMDENELMMMMTSGLNAKQHTASDHSRPA